MPGNKNVIELESFSARGGDIASPPTQSADFVESVCLPALRSAQNEDGGWGFRVGSASRVEATCWALHALMASGNAPAQVCGRGLEYLHSAQLPDGSWPFAAGAEVGCSATALACWAMLSANRSSNAVAAGLNCLNQDSPRDSVLW